MSELASSPVRSGWVDLSADPFVPEGLTLSEHVRSDPMEWALEKVRLHLDDVQNDGYIEGLELYKKINSRFSPYNANLLDFLLKNKHLIPKAWMGDHRGNMQRIFFLGTTYVTNEALCCRCLLHTEHGWESSYYMLFVGFCESCPVIVPA